MKPWVVPPPRMQSSPPGLWTIFRLGDPNLNLHLPQLLGGGDNPNETNGVFFFGGDLANFCTDTFLPDYQPMA